MATDDSRYDVLIEDVLVIGVQYKAEAVSEFVEAAEEAIAAGDLDSLGIRLTREPNNPHDRLAVKVIGTWEDGYSKKSRHIGYIPRSEAYRISVETEEGDKLRGSLLSIDRGGQYVNIRIDVLVRYQDF